MGTEYLTIRLNGDLTYREAVDSFLRALIGFHLELSRGSTTEAADRLGITREGMYRIRRRVGMPIRPIAPRSTDER